MSSKRKDYLNWDEYFMAIAKLSAMRSKDPSTQVGACIVSENNRIFYQLVKIVNINFHLRNIKVKKVDINFHLV